LLTQQAHRGRKNKGGTAGARGVDAKEALLRGIHITAGGGGAFNQREKYRGRGAKNQKRVGLEQQEGRKKKIQSGPDHKSGKKLYQSEETARKKLSLALYQGAGA